MNRLAQFVAEFVNGGAPEEAALSECSRAALEDLRPALLEGPEVLASRLMDARDPASDWLIPPPLTASA